MPKKIEMKILLVEINSLYKGEGCFASNKYLSDFLQVSEGRMANILTKLRKENHIETVKTDGRKRWISVKADFTKTLTETSRKGEHSNTVNNTKKKTPTPLNGKAVKDKEELARLYDSYHEISGKTKSCLC